MLATAGTLPSAGDEHRWAFEMKWDGVRVVAAVRAGEGPGAVLARSRRGRDVTATYPELAPVPPALAGRRAVVDGEVVALDAAGRPSFEQIQQRMNVAAPDARLLRAVPVQYLVFDLLHLDGQDLCGLPYEQRRARLEDLGIAGGAWGVPPVFEGDGAAALDAARRLGLEGVVAKRLDAPYTPGRRSPAWVKVKLLRTQEVVVCGWAEGEGRRGGGIGSLVLGVHDEAGRLRYAGRVGTGFTEAALDDLEGRLRPLERPAPPFAAGGAKVPAKGVHWVEPVLVGEVRFGEWTREGSLRQPAWRGLRPDKAPSEVVRES
ncbi:MAG: hypothetical protein HYX34_13350 [Actinobacteria bacterium]|nr:hypothetical protein [Actinomycetota bacterium]